MTSRTVTICLDWRQVRVHVAQLGPRRFLAATYDGTRWGFGVTEKGAIAACALYCPLPKPS